MPQLLYWHYTTGSFITYSYGNEGFSNLFSPPILEVLFAPKNGLLPYSLALIFMMIGLYFFIPSYRTTGTYIALTFLTILYLTASWHDPQFGCGCGQRNFVEYYALLIFPLAFFMQKVGDRKPKSKMIFYTIIALFAVISFKINYHFFGCYLGDLWNWEDYLKTLIYPLKIS